MSVPLCQFQQWHIERDANERVLIPLFLEFKTILTPFLQRCLFLLYVFALCRPVACVLTCLILHALCVKFLLSCSILTWGWKLFPDHLPPLKLTYLKCTTLQINIFYFEQWKIMRKIHKRFKWWIAHFEQSSPPFLPPYKLNCKALCPYITLYRTSQLNRLMFSPSFNSSTTAQVLDIDIYCFLICHIIIIGPTWWLKSTEMIRCISHFQAISQILYIQSIIGVLYSAVIYVWAQDIMWDWMWCSSYCRKKKALLLLFTLSLLFHMIFLRCILSYFVTFYVCF